ncbi:MAG TPA: TlpA disulfide reductase family protein [Gemmatimonadaceae bacterium]|nr:TlpA disulfide reductase family protein [Gemmatimonadaceae bacterium]
MVTTRVRRHARLFAVCLAGAALPACEPIPSGAVGAPAPAYRSATMTGDTASLESLRGRTVLLNVWATWCYPCREELPVLQQLHEAHASRGLVLIGVSIDAGGSGAAITEFARTYGVTYPLWHDPDNTVSAVFQGIGVPLSVLIGPDGIIRWKHLGPVRANDPALAAALEEALREVESAG